MLTVLHDDTKAFIYIPYIDLFMVYNAVSFSWYTTMPSVKKTDE